MVGIDVAALCVGALFSLGLLGILFANRRLARTYIYSATIVPNAALAMLGVAVLAGVVGPSSTVLPVGLPWIGTHLRLDHLSAFFLIVTGIGGGLTSLFAIGYDRHDSDGSDHGYEAIRVLPFYPAFLGSMVAVVLADDAFTFLVSWEVMSLLSWGLVLARHHADETRRAAYVYLVMAGFGTMALLLAFGLLTSGDGGYAFDTIRAGVHSPIGAAAILALMTLGAGSKAGLVPLHVWLPLAHPAAPSHVSALMSGVMTKVAIYGFIRVVFDLVGPLDWWASPMIVLLGAGTAVIGILNAVLESDIKKVLAYSTIENVGVIFCALGLALAFRANGMAAHAALAFTAALFHVFNHMAFKTLLFMGAGAVLNATGLRELDGLGGLIHRMPTTSVLVLVGITAISALPPLNGFASEWLVFQSVLKSPDLPQIALQIMIPAAGGLLALAAALAASAFVRLYGIGFLGRSRSDAALRADEAHRVSLAAMASLAALCVLAGIFPGVVVDAIAPAVHDMVDSRLPEQTIQPWLTLVPIAEQRSTYNGLLVMLFIAVSGSAAVWIIHRFASHRLRRGPAWDCGFPNADPMAQYGAASFAQPIRRVLGTVVLRVREEVEMPEPGNIAPARLTVRSRDLIWEDVYLRVADTVATIATRMNSLQFLTIRRYLLLVTLFLVGLLMVLTLWN